MRFFLFNFTMRFCIGSFCFYLFAVFFSSLVYIICFQKSANWKIFLNFKFSLLHRRGFRDTFWRCNIFLCFGNIFVWCFIILCFLKMNFPLTLCRKRIFYLLLYRFLTHFNWTLLLLIYFTLHFISFMTIYPFTHFIFFIFNLNCLILDLILSHTWS